VGRGFVVAGGWVERLLFRANFFADFELSSDGWTADGTSWAEFRRSDFLPDRSLVFSPWSTFNLAMKALISKAETVPSAHNKVGKILIFQFFFRADSPCG